MDCLKQNIPDDPMIGATPECKSWVASRYTVLNDAGVWKRRCKHADCDKEYSKGTSHMILKRHWARAHDDIFAIIRPRSSIQAAAKSSHKKKKSPLKASNSGPTGASPRNMKVGTPISNHANDKSQQFDVKHVSKRLREATSIHLTFDIHTPKKLGKTYGIITAHSLSESMDIKSVLLEYKHLPYPDDSTTIYEFLRSCIIKFNCRDKIISIASNGTDAVASAIHELDKRYRLSKNYNFSTIHIKCFPQFIHLNVSEVLKSQETLINGMRKIVGFINSNNFSMRPLSQNNPDGTSGSTETANTITNNTDPEAKSTGLKLPLDTRTCWSTTFIMIETFLQQRGFIEPTLLYFQDTQDLTNITIDWDRLFTLVHLLKPFHDVVSKFVTDNYTPVSLVAACIPHLMDHLSNSTWGCDDLAIIAHQFKVQIDNYREFFQSDLTVIAGLLDPRIKDTFTSPERKEDVIEILRKRLSNPPAFPLKPQESIPFPENSILSRIFNTHSGDEVLDYLESPRLHGYTNVPAYWEAYKQVYPTLYGLAKTLSCVQASSVPSDRLFSAAENIEKERKIQMDGTNSRELIKSWAQYLQK